MEKMSKQIIPLLRPGSREMERIAAMADTRYILLQITDEEIELGQFAEERLYAIAEMTQAGIVYADYREEKAGELLPHPLIDYQEGSLRNDFDFGKLLFIRTSALKEAVRQASGVYNHAGLYDVRLNISRAYPIVHVNEYLYTAKEKDIRSSGQKLFDYYLNRVEPYENTKPSEHPFLGRCSNCPPLIIGRDVTLREVKRAMAAYYANVETVDEQIGTNRELAALTGELRKRGISLCLDVVMNHTADTHEWAVRAKAGEKEYQDRYYCYDTWEIPSQFEQTMPQVFPATAPGNFTWCEEMKKYVLTTFYPYQWDLNYRNPVVFNEMTANILFLANLGVEIFRIDAVPYIWKELGTSCRNLPQVHRIVRMLRMVLEVVCPAVILKGEVVMAPQELPAYFGTPQHPECHMLYGVSSMVNLWAALATQDTRLLKHQMDVIHSLPDNCWFVNYLRCHDDIGWGLDEEEERRLMIDPLLHKEYLYRFYEGSFPGSFARGELYNFDPVSRDARSCGTTASLCGIEKGGFEGDQEQVRTGIRRDLLMHAACMSLEGFLMLSSGDEIGQVNDYSYKENPDTAQDSRYLHRSPFNWENAALRTVPGTVQQEIWDGLKQMEELRRNEPCFGPDARVTTWDTLTPKVFAIRRTWEERELVCLANFSGECQQAHLPSLSGTYQDLFTGETFAPQAVPLAPYQYRWMAKG